MTKEEIELIMWRKRAQDAEATIDRVRDYATHESFDTEPGPVVSAIGVLMATNNTPMHTGL